MKKAISVLCLFAMLLSLAAVMSVQPSAKTVNNSKYYGVYTATAPTIDGEIDKIWNDTIAMPFGNSGNGYIKVMWNGTTEKGTLYLLAVVNGCEEVDFIISTRFYSNTGAPWSWGGNYGFNINANTDSSAAGYSVIPSKADFLTASQTSKDATIIKSKATETGFVAEMSFTLSSANAGGFIHEKGFFGIGAFVNGDYTVAGNTFGLDDANIKKSPGYIYGIKMVCLHKDPVLQTVTTAPTLTTAGKGTYKCSYCGTTVEKTIPATTIQWLGVQGLTTIPEGATKTSVRLVSQIKDLKSFSAVGYEITASTGTAKDALTPLSGKIDKEMTSVYRSILAAGKKVEPENGGQYLVAIVMEDIPLYAADGSTPLYVSITVKPYTKDAKGNKVYMTGTDSVTFVLTAGVPVTD